MLGWEGETEHVGAPSQEENNVRWQRFPADNAGHDSYNAVWWVGAAATAAGFLCPVTYRFRSTVGGRDSVWRHPIDLWNPGSRLVRPDYVGDVGGYVGLVSVLGRERMTRTRSRDRDEFAQPYPGTP